MESSFNMIAVRRQPKVDRYPLVLGKSGFLINLRSCFQTK